MEENKKVDSESMPPPPPKSDSLPTRTIQPIRPPESSWYIKRSDKREGPFSVTDIEELYFKGKINKDTIIENDIVNVGENCSLGNCGDFEYIFDIEKESKKKEKKQQSNTSIYVTGLPPDTTIDELSAYFGSCGVIRKDLDTDKEMIQLYVDEEGKQKGDALVTYLLWPSVGLAIDMKDDSYFRPSSIIRVTQADDIQVKKGKRKKKKIDHITAAIRKRKYEDQLKLVSWDEGLNEDESGLRIITLKNVFSVEKASGDPYFFEELSQEIGEECERIAGDIEKMTIFRSNPEGVIVIKFKSSSSVECIKIMNGRFFGGRKLSCEYFDGTNYGEGTDTLENEEARLEAFGRWLENGSDSE